MLVAPEQILSSFFANKSANYNPKYSSCLAVRNGERPSFSDVIASKYGLLTLTQLMVKMWKQDGTERPEAKTVLEQLNNCSFQLLYGKRVLRMQNPRFICDVAGVCELWVASDDIKGEFDFLGFTSQELRHHDFQGRTASVKL